MQEVNYSILDVEASSIYFDVEKRAKLYAGDFDDGSVQSCPAVRLYQSRSFIVRSPFDIRLRARNLGSEISIHLIPKDTSIAPQKLRELMTISPKQQWRRSNSPVLQISTPYVFYSNFSCNINQRHPVEFAMDRLGWRLIEGSFNIHRWKRPLSWAVEWEDLTRDLWLKRGDPWFALDFSSADFEESVRLKREATSVELQSEILKNKDVSAYIKGTFSLQRGNDER